MSEHATITTKIIPLVRTLLEAEMRWQNLDEGLQELGIDLGDRFAPHLFDTVVEMVFGLEDGKCFDWIYEDWADKQMNAIDPVESFIKQIVKPHLLSENRITVDD